MQNLQKIFSEPRSGEDYKQKGSPTPSLDESIEYLPLLKRCLKRSLVHVLRTTSLGVYEKVVGNQPEAGSDLCRGRFTVPMADLSASIGINLSDRAMSP